MIVFIEYSYICLRMYVCVIEVREETGQERISKESRGEGRERERREEKIRETWCDDR